MSAQIQPQQWPMLSHFTRQRLGKVLSKTQPGTQEGWGLQNKPVGLWVSVDGENDWAEWCKSEEYDGLGKFQYRITLSDPASLLWIADELELLAFTERYDKPFEYRGGYRAYKGRYIDWPRVAIDWPGMVVSPYQWGCRLRNETSWYYGWDCASGCIWDARMIAATELIA